MADARVSVPLLKEVRLLRPFSDPELTKILAAGKVISFEPHTNVVIEGELSWGLYIILEGLVGIYKTNKLSGDVYDVGQLRSGNFFGEMSLVDDNPRSATVRTLTECQLFHIQKSDFNVFLNTSPNLRPRFYESCIQDLVGRLRELDDNYVVSQYQLWKAAVHREAA